MNQRRMRVVVAIYTGLYRPPEEQVVEAVRDAVEARTARS
jgi:hypothetical protein